MGKKKPIISPFGQWAYPGEVTIIPSSDITMKGVNYPVLGIDDLGNQQMMMPGQDYTFPGNYVTEYPQMGKGGQMIKRKDGSYSQRGLWDNIRANKGSGKKPTKQMLEQERKIKAKMKNGGWLDQYQDGSEVPSNIERMDPVNIKIKRKNVSDSPKYQYDNKGNLLYTPDLNIYPYLSDNSSRDSFWVTPKIPIQNLNPTVEELRTVAAPYYPIDNKLVSDPKLTFKYSEAKPSNYQESLEQEYVLPQVIGKSFGNLPLVKDDGYSPNRRWITSLRNGDKLSTGYRYNSGLYAYGPNNYAYVLKTDPNNLVNYATKDKIENDLSLNDKALYDYLAKINYSPDNVYGLTRKLPDQIWNRAEQMRVEMRNNPEIMSWANLHNVDLGYKERYEDNEDNDDYAPKIPESIYAARLAKAGLPTNRPDYDYGDFETYIAQDPSKFNLVDYFPVDSFLKDAQNNPNNEKYEWGEVKDDQALKKQMAKRMGIDPSAFDSGEYLIHYNKTPITEYTPGKKYGGWLSKYQSGGLSMGDYDLTTAPKRGDYLLPDINRPSYIDEAGNKRSEYRMGKNIDGKETLIPTVVGGKQLSEDEALDRYYKTGLHMGQFNTPEEADYASRLRTARYNMLEDPIRFQADQFQVGGRAPIYTSNPNDSRLRSYNDSTRLYEQSKYLRNLNSVVGNRVFTPYKNWKPWVYDPIDLKKRNALTRQDILQSQAQELSDYNSIANDIKKRHSTIKPESILTLMNDGSNWPNRQPVLEFIGPVYKKPVQPILYKKPVPKPVYKKPEVVPVPVVETVPPVSPIIEQPIKKVGYTQPIIQQFNYMSNENKAKALQKYGSVSDIPFQGVDINQLKDGGWLDEYQRGGMLPPIYTSDFNDPRIGRYNDSLDLYNKNTLGAYNLLKKYPAFKLPKVESKLNSDSEYLFRAPYSVTTEKYIDYGDHTIRNTAKGIRKNNGNINDIRNYDFAGSHALEWESDNIKNKIKPIGYQFVPETNEKYIDSADYSNSFPVYKKPVQPIIYKPSLAISNIDRDMYTPGGGMGREYNIGITLQDGSKKAFRTEKEYQDWKAANNLDISNAKVTEGKGYSYDYPENKKYGGWLDQFQTGSEVPSDIERMDPAVIKRDRSWLDKLKGYIHRGEKAIGLDPYNERPDDFMEQWARRINTATGGKDWYKQPNDASGAGGIGTAVMETVMAPFSAPQLASVYGATGKVQMPSEAMNIQNPVGSFLADAILDPTNLVGAGIAKNLGKGSLQNMVRSRMRGARPDLQRYVDNVSNELPAPPSELRLNESTGQLDPYYNTERPYFDQWMRTLNATSNSQDVADLFANPSGSIDLRKLKKNVKNKSGLTKEEILKNASLKDKEALSKMSESEFEETVLKPTGEIVRYNPGYDNDTIRGMYFWAPTRQNQLANASQLSYDEYANIFNSKLDVLNDIIAKNNKSGLEYKVKQLSPSGNLTFHTPSQIEKLPPNSDMLNTLRDRGFIDPAGNIDPRFQDYADRWGINGNRNIPEGESTWRLNINPGQWRGDVEDIPYAEYYKAIPGLNMKDTTASVFSDAMPRRGTGAYESINEYLKLMDLGRVKPGFNLQTQYSSGLWQDAIKKGKAYGYFHNPTTIYGSMKTVAPLAVGAAAASQLQEQKQGGQTNWLNKYK